MAEEDLAEIDDDATHDPTDAAFLDPLAVDGDEEASTLAVFEGDEGSLEYEERRCLVNILKKHVLTRDRNPREWATLVESERTIRGRLNDMFLNLVIDHARGVAYKVQVRHAVSGMFPPLLHDSSYSREETVLLVFLRQRYSTERNAGQESVFVDREECVEAVASFRPANATDVTGDQARANNAVDSLRTSGVLLRSGQEDRFEISPVIEVLLPVAQLKNLLEWFVGQNSPEAADD